MCYNGLCMNVCLFYKYLINSYHDNDIEKKKLYKIAGAYKNMPPCVSA